MVSRDPIEVASESFLLAETVRSVQQEPRHAEEGGDTSRGLKAKCDGEVQTEDFAHDLFSISQIFGMDADFVKGALTIKEVPNFSALRNQVHLVCSMGHLYQHMLSLEGLEAQRWLDSLQKVHASLLPVLV